MSPPDFSMTAVVQSGDSKCQPIISVHTNGK